MKRWHFDDMEVIGQKLFAKIYKKRRCSRHNHDIHILAREINDWLPKSIQAMIDGTYTPRHLKRRYFPDEMIDQLHLSDRILQHILLTQLKSTILHVTNPNCVHVHGPTGVKMAQSASAKRLQQNNITTSYVRILNHFTNLFRITNCWMTLKKHMLIQSSFACLKKLLKILLKHHVDIKIRLQALHYAVHCPNFLVRFI
jgi:hypothetical protein